MKHIPILILLLLISFSSAKTPKEDLILAWEKNIKSDSTTLHFEKIANNKYRYKSTYFSYDGDLEILNIHIQDENLNPKFPLKGIVEVNLLKMTRDSIQKHEMSYAYWRQFHTLRYYKPQSRWLSSEEFNSKSNEYYDCGLTDRYNPLQDYLPYAFLFLLSIITIAIMRFMSAMKMQLEINATYLRQIREILQEKFEKE